MLFIYLAGRVVFVFQVAAYFISNYRLLRKGNENMLRLYSNMEGRSLQWVRVLNLTLTLTSLASIMLAIIGRNFFLTNDYFLAVPSVAFSTLLFSIGLIGSKQKHGIPELYTNISPPESFAPEKNCPEVRSELIGLFEQGLLFKNPGFAKIV